MNKLIKFYNQNRGMFWIIVVVIIGVIALIQSLNNYYKDKNNQSSGIENTTTYNTIQTPSISGEKVSESTSKESINIIDNFIILCNNKKIEEAYKFLSEDCKKELYPDIDTFKNDYIDKIFSEYRIYDVKTWITASNSITYRIELSEDILSTGGTSDLSIEEYYTIIKEDNEYKLNIHNYIGKQEINVKKSLNNVDFEIVERYIYMEDETYKINVKNNTNKKIMVDSKETTRSVNISDQNGLKYVAFLNEIGENDLTLLPGMEKDIKIKFNKSYNPNYADEYIQFSSIVLDTNNKSEKSEIKIEL